MKRHDLSSAPQHVGTGGLVRRWTIGEVRAHRQRKGHLSRVDKEVIVAADSDDRIGGHFRLESDRSI